MSVWNLPLLIHQPNESRRSGAANGEDGRAASVKAVTRTMVYRKHQDTELRRGDSQRARENWDWVARQEASRGAIGEPHAANQDLVGAYLDESGRTPLLDASQEKELASRMEEGRHLMRLEEVYQNRHGRNPSPVELLITLLDRF